MHVVVPEPLRTSGRHALAFVTFAFYGAAANASGSQGLATNLPVARVSGNMRTDAIASDWSCL